MAISRRKAIGGTVAVVAAAAATSLWRLYQTLPPQDPAAEERFRKAQDALLAQSGNTIQSHFVEIANPKMRAQVLEGGEGDPLVLIHGGDGFAAQLEPLLSRLSDGFHVYAPDRPGCGLSDMFDYRGVPLREHAVNFVTSTLTRWACSVLRWWVTRWADTSALSSLWLIRSGYRG
jgi:pimeloyl-ACP methyl ester carboxylesterase